MGQGDIIKILERSKKPLTSTEIAEKLKKSRSPISTSLNKLKKQGLVGFYQEKNPKGYGNYIYRHFLVKKYKPKHL
jgi:predicted transcriptional regulator